MFSGPERWRLASGILMLIMLCLLIVRMRDPDRWRWLVPDKAPEPRAAAPAQKVPAPTGPTDEDPEQADAAREEFQALTDGGLELGPEEMEAYNRLVFWVHNQSFARLWQRATRGCGTPTSTTRRASIAASWSPWTSKSPVPRASARTATALALCEVWGATEESGAACTT